jgi:hypothetical protein
MNPTKDEIKSWLKREGHTREWLGIQCGNIKRRTVDNWLSSPQEIPEGALYLIARLMAEDTEKSKNKADPQHHLILTVPLEEFRAWEQAALLKTKTTTAYCVEAIRDAYQEDMRLTVVPAHHERPAAEKQG